METQVALAHRELESDCLQLCVELVKRHEKDEADEDVLYDGHNEVGCHDLVDDSNQLALIVHLETACIFVTFLVAQVVSDAANGKEYAKEADHEIEQTVVTLDLLLEK